MSNSIINLLNDSLNHFRQTRASNNSRKSPNPRSLNTSFNKLNTSNESSTPFKSQSGLTAKTPIQVSLINPSFKPNQEDSFTNILNSDSYFDYQTANHAIQSSKDSEELEKLFQEINYLKQDQKSLESQVQVLETKILKNLNTLNEPLSQTDFYDIIDRITQLQSKFTNRNKSSLATEKLSVLFQKLSNLEAEAEGIKRENTEVENLYHESLNEIYEKIDKLKRENKNLTDLILSNNSSSPSQSRKFMYSHDESIKKIEKKDPNPALFHLKSQKLQTEHLIIEKELSEIPQSSKSLANKKLRLKLEKDLQTLKTRQENLQ